LSAVLSSPRSSAGCIQGQLTRKTDLSEKHLLALELLEKKFEKASLSAALGSLCYEASLGSYFQAEVLILELQLSYTAAALQPQPCLATYPTDLNES